MLHFWIYYSKTVSLKFVFSAYYTPYPSTALGSQWLRHGATIWKVAGSIPDGIIEFQ